MTLHCRLATLDDIDGLCGIDKEAFGGESHSRHDRTTRRQFRYLLTQAHAEMYVVERDGQIVGYASVLMREGSTQIHGWSVAILEEARGQGVATAFFAWAEQRWVSMGYDRASFEVHVNNPGAQRLYTRMGYEITEPLPDYFDVGDSGIRMVKRLVD